jgi:hypothetical protein
MYVSATLPTSLIAVLLVVKVHIVYMFGVFTVHVSTIHACCYTTSAKPDTAEDKV